mmetsp:Transcript_21573/g.40646  ORF Transcript_21573/g.40646 Transcript_21573/m.40646 type:complete len:136 (-) Transcript_21573:1785-2192(-)
MYYRQGQERGFGDTSSRHSFGFVGLSQRGAGGKASGKTADGRVFVCIRIHSWIAPPSPIDFGFFSTEGPEIDFVDSPGSFRCFSRRNEIIFTRSIHYRALSRRDRNYFRTIFSSSIAFIYHPSARIFFSEGRMIP